MNKRSSSSRRSPRETWTHDRLHCERAVAITCVIEPSSMSSYSSAVNSYFAFCSAHSFLIEPTPDTLSSYAVYMVHHIKPKSVSSYLLGVCSQLEPFFFDVWLHRHHWLVLKTLEGCHKMFPLSTSRKRPLTRSELADVSHQYSSSLLFDDSLFLTLLLTGFHGLLRLGEFTWPDKRNLQDYQKVVMRNLVCVDPKFFQFTLPGHKADRFFEGSLVLIQLTDLADDPFVPFVKYLSLRDCCFPFCVELWLKGDGTVPTRAWILHLLQKHFQDNVGGHSLRAGGATALAEAGIPVHMIQAIGRWSSEAFQIYICCHPVLLTSLLYGSLSRSTTHPLNYAYHHSSP